MKKYRVGFDLDGVLVDKPPLMPHWLLHWLFKGSRKKLDYHCPSCGWRRQIRIWSHRPCLRPPIKDNIAFLKKLAQKPEIDLYLITSRYSFLKKATERILRRRGLEGLFSKVIINERNEPPHLFKARTIEKLGIEVYFEDDPEVIDYLKTKLPNLKIGAISAKAPCQDCWKEIE